MDSKTFNGSAASTALIVLGFIGFGAGLFSLFHWVFKFNTIYSVVSTLSSMVIGVLLFFKQIFAT